MKWGFTKQNNKKICITVDDLPAVTYGSTNKNTVGKIPTLDGIIHGSTGMLFDNSDEFYRAENGHAIGYFWGYETAGIFQNQQEKIILK